MFCHPYSHFVLLCLLEFASLFRYYLFVVQHTLCTCFLPFQFLLVVTDNFKLFHQFIGHFRCTKHLLLIPCHEVHIFHFLEIAVGNYTSRVVELHTNSVRIKDVSDTELRVLLEIGDPNVRSMWDRL
jgi:hypothetical protein